MTQAAAKEEKYKREKMQVELQILSAGISVPEYKDLFVEWSRNGQSIKTKKLSVDENNSRVLFSKGQGKFTINASFYRQQSDGNWRVDKNTLTLVVGGATIGVCTLNLSDYIGRNPKKHKENFAETEGAVGTNAWIE